VNAAMGTVKFDCPRVSFLMTISSSFVPWRRVWMSRSSSLKLRVLRVCGGEVGDFFNVFQQTLVEFFVILEILLKDL
jgi:hypothetical protein